MPGDEKASRDTTDAAPPASLDDLMPVVYDHLRRIAHRKLLAERPDHTLTTTALVHEAYLRLAEQHAVPWHQRSQVMAIAARAMRRILIDYARAHRAERRGGDRVRVALDDTTIALDERAGMLIALDEALSRLAGLDERQGRVVECRFFGGMTEDETAEALGITARTVRRDWTSAKAWLYRELDGE